MGGRAVSNLIVSGEAPIVVNNRRSHMYASAKQGAHVAWRALGPSYTSVSGAALATQAPHPHAAMLFIDFLLGRAAQRIYTQDLGYASMRRDMQSDDAPAQKLYLTLRPDFYREYEEWNDLSDAVFRAAK
jgi:ABC-type Fe3+ transport system substrate-binding protein